MSFENTDDFATASFEKLMKDAVGTVTREYLPRVVADLDADFGAGYAKKNPELVGQLVTAASNDFNSAVQSKAFGALNNTFTEVIAALDHIAQNVGGTD